MKKTWSIFLPDWSELDRLWQSPHPFCLWPVGNQPFIAHWMDKAVEDQIDHITLYTADRPLEIRKFLDEGAFWSKSLEIVPIRSDDEAPETAMPIVGLPQNNHLDQPIEGDAGLLRHWLDLNKAWLSYMDSHSIKIEIQHTSGGWVGPHVRIHPKAKLVPPFWIQGRCEIGANAQIGPDACVGENSIVDENAIIKDSIVLPGTMVGSNTSLDGVAVQGGLLLDSRHACRVSITDSFVLSDISESIASTRLSERLIALSLFCILSPIAALSRIDWSMTEVHDGRGGALKLKTGRNGCLILRRWHWLKEVIKGRMRLVGILPRPLTWKPVPADQDVTRRLISTPPGIISLSDLHDCHSADDPLEWVHASYQALNEDGNITKLVRSQLWKTAFKAAS